MFTDTIPTRPTHLRSSLAAALAIMLSILWTVGCGEDPVAGGAATGGIPETGSVSVFITDSPSDDFDKILLTIDSIALLGGGPQTEIFTGEEVIDLKDLENFSDLFVYAEEVPARPFSKIRLGVNKIQLVREGEDAEVIDVDPPANGKVDIIPGGDPHVRPGINMVIEIDIDAKKSIHIVQAGKGKYVFRPVIFATIRDTHAPRKLGRVHGVITEIFDEESFELCSTMFMASREVGVSRPAHYDGGLGDRHRCMTVELDGDTGLFDANGDPALAENLKKEEEVTVVGRFHMVDADHDEVAIPLSFGRHHDHKKGRGSPKKKGKKDKDGDSGSDSHADSDSDTDSDSHGGPHPKPPEYLIVLHAYVVEMGPAGTFLQLAGVVETDLDDQDEFDFRLAPGQGFGDDSVVVALLQLGTRLFNRLGMELDDSDVQAETLAKIDGVFSSSPGEGSLYKTALLILDVAIDHPDVLRGEIFDVDDVTRTLGLLVDDDGEVSEECVRVPEDAEVWLISMGASERGDFDDLDEGQRIDAWGMYEDAFECFVGDRIIVFLDDPATCTSNEDCEVDAFCDTGMDACEGEGECRPRPELCPLEFAPVCGCDGEDYGNRCKANEAGASVAHQGPCEDPENVCGGEGELQCDPGELCLIEDGECSSIALGECVKEPAECSDAEKPVCGCDGKNYLNRCRAAKAGATVASEGVCEPPKPVACTGNDECMNGEFCDKPKDSCENEGLCREMPSLCTGEFSPVCGCDELGYANACLANQAGTSIASPGACETPENFCGGESGTTCEEGLVCLIQDGMCSETAEGTCVKPPGECTGIEKPVCGCDDKNYPNRCVAAMEGATVKSEGACPTPVP